LYNKGIDIGLDKNSRNEVIARKIYLSFPTQVFIGKEELEFELISSICNQFKIPFCSVQVAGSAKSGYSYYKKKEFKLGESDLDIAIVDENLFIQYCEIILRETKGFKDLSKFGRTKDGVDKFDLYKQYITRGIFRPDLMPLCDANKKWFNFFNKLSEKYFDLFSDINAGIYLSQKFFEYKQADNIDFYKNEL